MLYQRRIGEGEEGREGGMMYTRGQRRKEDGRERRREGSCLCAMCRDLDRLSLPPSYLAHGRADRNYY